MHLLLIGPLPNNKTYPGGPQVSFFYLLDELKKKDNIKITVINTMAKNRFERSLLLFRWILKMLFNVPKVDIISLHASTNSTLLFGPIAWFISKGFNKKFTLRVFGGSIGRAYFNQNFFFQWLIRKTIFSSDIVFLQTKELVNSLSNQIQGTVVWYPTSRPLFANRNNNYQNTSNNLKDSKFKFVFLGDVKPSKGIKELIAAVDELNNQNIEVNVYGPLLEGISHDFFKNTMVKYEGVLMPENVPKTLENHDVLLLPTYYEGEGYPGVIIEAYSVGVPVITTNWMNIPEIVDESCGILIEPKSINQLAEAMEKLVKSPEILNRLKIGAKGKAKQFSSGALSEKFLIECYKLISKGK